MTTRAYTPQDVEDFFEELRLLVNARDYDDPDHDDYTFRLDALIRFWLMEMAQHTTSEAQMLDALQGALRWAGWQAVFYTDTGTVQ